VSDQTGADFVSGATVSHWTRRRALTVLAAAWAAPGLLTLATIAGAYFAIDGLMPHWTPISRGVIQALGAAAAASIVHLAASLALRRTLGHPPREPNPGLMEIAPWHVSVLGLSSHTARAS
jgi:hypothetical protein